MKVFVFEFVTGGGYAGQALPEFLPDGETLWRALIDDLIAVDGVEVLTLRDERLPQPDQDRVHIVTTVADRFEDDFHYCLMSADAVWIVAPEEKDLLETLNRDVLHAGKRLLGCRPEAVRVAASKYVTARQLGSAGIAVAPTYSSPYLIVEDGPVVAKPDKGADCQDILYFANLTTAEEWVLRHGGAGFVFQRFISGDYLSLSLLCHENNSQLLSVNRQHIGLENDGLRFLGVTPDALPDADGRYADLARKVVSAIPGLWGYVGIDLVDTDFGSVILEVSPRVTVSYAGLRAALNVNPAEKVLSLPDIQA